MAASEPKAKCGHPDTFGFLAGTVCRKCADKGHASVTGKGRK